MLLILKKTKSNFWNPAHLSMASPFCFVLQRDCGFAFQHSSSCSNALPESFPKHPLPPPKLGEGPLLDIPTTLGHKPLACTYCEVAVGYSGKEHCFGFRKT